MKEAEASDMFKVGCLGGGRGGKHLQCTVGCLFSQRQQQRLLKSQHLSLLVPKHRPENGWKGLAWCCGLTPVNQELNLPGMSGD